MAGIPQHQRNSKQVHGYANPEMDAVRIPVSYFFYIWQKNQRILFFFLSRKIEAIKRRSMDSRTYLPPGDTMARSPWKPRPTIINTTEDEEMFFNTTYAPQIWREIFSRIYIYLVKIARPRLHENKTRSRGENKEFFYQCFCSFKIAKKSSKCLTISQQ